VRPNRGVREYFRQDRNPYFFDLWVRLARRFWGATRGLETFGRHVYVGAAWIATHLLFLIGLGMVLWSARFLGEFGWRMPERRFRVLGIVFVLFAVILMLTVWDSK